MRDLSRTRKQLTREIIQHTNRIQKVLEDANIKLASAISNVLGKSGRAVLEAIVAGQSDPEKLVDLCAGRLKATRKELVEAMRGRVTAHHRFLLKLHLAQVDQLTAGMRELEARMGEILAPFQEHVDNLASLPCDSATGTWHLAGLQLSNEPSPEREKTRKIWTPRGAAPTARALPLYDWVDWSLQWRPLSQCRIDVR